MIHLIAMNVQVDYNCIKKFLTDTGLFSNKVIDNIVKKFQKDFSEYLDYLSEAEDREQKASNSGSHPMGRYKTDEDSNFQWNKSRLQDDIKTTFKKLKGLQRWAIVLAFQQCVDKSSGTGRHIADAFENSFRNMFSFDEFLEKAKIDPESLPDNMKKFI